MNRDESGSRDILRSQRMVACEVAYRALAESDDGPLRWFTTDVLELPKPWAPYVAMAMWQTEWRRAENPIGWLRVVTGRTVKKWHPALVGQSWKERDPKVVVATDLKRPQSDDGYSYREGDTGALGFHLHLAEEGGIIGRDGHVRIGNGQKRNGRRWRNPNTPRPPRKKPGESRLGPDDRALIDARIAGCTRQTAGAHLGWSQSRVERVWRRVNRDQNN